MMLPLRARAQAAPTAMPAMAPGARAGESVALAATVDAVGVEEVVV